MTDLYPAIEPTDSGMLDVGEGHRVYWETCGNPVGRPALVLHGGPGSGCTANARRPRGGAQPVQVTAGILR